MRRKKKVLLLVLLVCILITLNYSFLDSALEKFLDTREQVLVERVIDGDTIVVGEDLKVRLFGINCPEKGEKYSEEAKKFLEKKILNKIIFVESLGKDLYYRELGVVFYKRENINLKLVEEGFANVYILKNKKYEEELREAWGECIKEENNLCKKSKNKCADCIELKKLNQKSQEVVFENKCGFDCDLGGWTIKDEGRKKFVFENFELERGKEVKIKVGEGEDTKDVLFWKGKNYVWTATGDSLFLRDVEGGLVLWERV